MHESGLDSAGGDIQHHGDFGHSQAVEVEQGQRGALFGRREEQEDGGVDFLEELPRVYAVSRSISP
ncbi:MAG: hypothetical protein WEB57_05990 [Pseudohongiellaceae bacterium]